MSDDDFAIERRPQVVITNEDGVNKAQVTNHEALQVTPPPEGKTAFGEASVAQLHPVVQVKFPYPVIDPEQVADKPNQSGTVTAANSQIICSTGAAANSGAEANSIDIVTYKPGQGISSRFTAKFTTGVADSTQIIGPGDSGEGFFFGYNGSSFGIMTRKDGVTEVRTLTITTASTTAENATITLDGDADATVAVTNSGNLTTTANEIADHDYSDVGDGWTSIAVGDTVVFTSWSDSAKTGTYSLVATTAVGAFAQTLAGADAVDTWVAQTAWNGMDKFDGQGITGQTLDPTKGNVYQIKYQYLGFGAIFFYIEDGPDGELHLVHTVGYANQFSTPSLNNPSLPICMAARNVANTSDLSISSSSWGMFIEGIEILAGPRRGVSANATFAAPTEAPLLTVRSKEVFASSLNRTKSKLLLVGVAVDHTKPVAINVYSNTILTDASFVDLDANYSIIEYDISATGFSGGIFQFSIELGRTGNEILDLLERHLDGELIPGRSYTFTASPTSANNAEASVSTQIVELF